MKQKPILVIVGPTASGKTDLSIKLADLFNGEVINADSTQIFCGTDIATNKITIEEMGKIKHHLLSIRPVTGKYSVAEFQNDSRNLINQIHNKNKLPIIVGGTGLYINALLKNFKFTDTEKILNFEQKNLRYSNHQLHKRLYNVDPELAKQIPLQNRKRILRGLELYEITKKTQKQRNENNNTYFYNNVYVIGLNPNRLQLHEKINRRVLDLVNRGLFNEIEQAYIINGKNSKAQALKAIGGPEIIAYLNGEITYEQSILNMQTANRRYARKQMTWFRNQLSIIKWYEYNFEDYNKITDNILSDIKAFLTE